MTVDVDLVTRKLLLIGGDLDALATVAAKARPAFLDSIEALSRLSSGFPSCPFR